MLFGVLGLLGGVSALSSCEDDSFYKAGPSTFQNDVLDGAAGAGMMADGGGGATGAAGAGADAGP
jgi:hypothetical protein